MVVSINPRTGNRIGFLVCFFSFFMLFEFYKSKIILFLFDLIVLTHFNHFNFQGDFVDLPCFCACYNSKIFIFFQIIFFNIKFLIIKFNRFHRKIKWKHE